jgi:hypothetical protein
LIGFIRTGPTSKSQDFDLALHPERKKLRPAEEKVAADYVICVTELLRYQNRFLAMAGCLNKGESAGLTRSRWACGMFSRATRLLAARLGCLNLGIIVAEHASHGAPERSHDRDRQDDNERDDQRILDQRLTPVLGAKEQEKFQKGHTADGLLLRSIRDEFSCGNLNILPDSPLFCSLKANLSSKELAFAESLFVSFALLFGGSGFRRREWYLGQLVT